MEINLKARLNAQVYAGVLYKGKSGSSKSLHTLTLWDKDFNCVLLQLPLEDSTPISTSEEFLTKFNEVIELKDDPLRVNYPCCGHYKVDGQEKSPWSIFTYDLLNPSDRSKIYISVLDGSQLSRFQFIPVLVDDRVI